MPETLAIPAEAWRNRARIARRLAANCLLATVLLRAPAFGVEATPGEWSDADSAAILEKMQVVRLAPSLADLTPGERSAIEKLVEAGRHLQRVYEDSLHPQALAAREELERRTVRDDSPELRQLATLYRLFQGPIATTLENQRVPFLPVAPQAPTRNVYPPGATAETLQAAVLRGELAASELVAERTVIQAASTENLDRDLATLHRYPALDELHPGLAERLASRRRKPDAAGFYAVPQSVRWADEIVPASRLLYEAADAVATDDAEFAGYLRNRARDLLSDDYESGDAAWVTGRFGRLNAQVGSYETYDDPLLGAKAFMSASVLLRNVAASEALQAAVGSGLQAIEDSLPYEPKRRVRAEVPIGVYEVVADFGQARSANTATILPNDVLYTRRYGRTILLRENVLRHPGIFANTKAAWDAVLAPGHADELVVDGNVQRTLWHEIGHYLGVDRDLSGRALDEALGAMADAYEEMKSDLVALHAVPLLLESGYYDAGRAGAVYASGIRRVLQSVRPRRDQAYQTMQLMQFNWFLDQGLLTWDVGAQRLSIDYGRYPAAVTSLLAEVLAIQQAGDPARAAAFMDRWTEWRPELHESIAGRIRATARYRYTLMQYEAIGD